MSIAVKIEHLSKRYRLGVINRHLLYRELQSWWAKKWGRPDPNAPIQGGKYAPPVGGESGEFYALRDICAEITEGEVVGIIGRNGAGKSTLLKILSQITAPSEGRVLLKGTVASLLEVGTGFHPELTGQENVFLNGAILGMSRRDIVRKYDEIAAFSGVEKFLDTPVKRYSSGMRVRLAFAVAAHLEPRILIIDEVLAVGDAEFQHKCLGKIGDVAREGRTVLFVSHNMAAVENLCRRGIVLEDGRLTFDGTQTDAITHYLHSVTPHESTVRERTDRSGTQELRITAIEFREPGGRRIKDAISGRDLEIHLRFENFSGHDMPNITVNIYVLTQYEIPVFTQSNRLMGVNLGSVPASGAFVCLLPRLPLSSATYRIGFSIKDGQGKKIDVMSDAAELHVLSGDFFGTGRHSPTKRGPCLLDGQWRMESGIALAKPASNE